MNTEQDMMMMAASEALAGFFRPPPTVGKIPKRRRPSKRSLAADVPRFHACGFPGCGKAYKTVAHVNRHKRDTGHDGTLVIRPCRYPGCAKVYVDKA